MAEHSKFLAWPSIGKLSDVGYHARGRKIKYNAKVKLHGTNAGIRVDKPDYDEPTPERDFFIRVTAQSRSRDLGVGKDDNFGFCEFVREHGHLLKPCHNRYDTVLFGEWYGSNIQPGVALSKVPEKHFALYAAVLDGNYVVDDPASLSELAGDFPCTVLPWYFHDDIEIDFDFPSQEVVEMINREVEAIDKFCPYAWGVHGAEGAGEGLVFYPREGSSSLENLGHHMFKAKGASHRVNGGKSAASLKPVASADVIAFVDSVLTEARYAQALHELQLTRGEVARTSEFIRWCVADVLKENQHELAASGLDARSVNKALGTRAAKWFTGT